MFRGEHIDFLDLWLFGEQFVGEGIEDTERCVVESQRESRRCLLLCLGHREG